MPSAKDIDVFEAICEHDECPSCNARFPPEWWIEDKDGKQCLFQDMCDTDIVRVNLKLLCSNCVAKWTSSEGIQTLKDSHEVNMGCRCRVCNKLLPESQHGLGPATHHHCTHELRRFRPSQENTENNLFPSKVKPLRTFNSGRKYIVTEKNGLTIYSTHTK